MAFVNILVLFSLFLGIRLIAAREADKAYLENTTSTEKTSSISDSPTSDAKVSSSNAVLPSLTSIKSTSSTKASLNTTNPTSAETSSSAVTSLNATNITSVVTTSSSKSSLDGKNIATMTFLAEKTVETTSFNSTSPSSKNMSEEETVDIKEATTGTTTVSSTTHVFITCGAHICAENAECFDKGDEDSWRCECKTNYSMNKDKCDRCVCENNELCSFDEEGKKKCSSKGTIGTVEPKKTTETTSLNSTFTSSKNVSDMEIVDPKEKTTVKTTVSSTTRVLIICGENGAYICAENEECNEVSLKCECETNYSMNKGKCEKCICKDIDRSCSFGNNGLKICSCKTGYEEINGTCVPIKTSTTSTMGFTTLSTEATGSASRKTNDSSIISYSVSVTTETTSPITTAETTSPITTAETTSPTSTAETTSPTSTAETTSPTTTAETTSVSGERAPSETSASPFPGTLPTEETANSMMTSSTTNTPISFTDAQVSITSDIFSTETSNDGNEERTTVAVDASTARASSTSGSSHKNVIYGSIVGAGSIIVAGGLLLLAMKDEKLKKRVRNTLGRCRSESEAQLTDPETSSNNLPV